MKTIWESQLCSNKSEVEDLLNAYQEDWLDFKIVWDGYRYVVFYKRPQEPVGGVSDEKQEVELRKAIGDELYNQLTNEQRQKIIKTASSLDLGPVDIERLLKITYEIKGSPVAD